MNTNQNVVTSVESKIYLIRGVKVILDFDLAELYQVSTRQLNQQVRRNIYRFPEDFMFSLSIHEFDRLMSQFVTSKKGRGGRRKLLESKYDGQFQLVFDAIREIMSEHAVPRKRVIGLDPPANT